MTDNADSVMNFLIRNGVAQRGNDIFWKKDIIEPNDTKEKDSVLSTWRAKISDSRQI